MCKQHPDLSPGCHVARVMWASPAIPEAGQLVMGILGDRNGQLRQILPDQPDSRPLHPEAGTYPGMGPARDLAQPGKGPCPTHLGSVLSGPGAIYRAGCYFKASLI